MKTDELHCCVTPDYVSVTSGRSVAEANIYPQELDVWWVARVLVQAKGRGKGLGSRLLQRLVQEIKGTGAKAVIVAPGGYNANYNRQVNFYEKNGFKEVSKRGLYKMEF